MKRFDFVLVIMTVCLASALSFAFGGIVSAQDEELTLAGLAEQVAALAGRVTALESIWEGPGAIKLGDGECLIGMEDGLQDETVLKYKEQFDEWVDTDDIWPVEIRYDTETGHTAIVYADGIGMFSSYIVNEVWDGCDFVGSSDWRENDRN